MSLGGEQRSVTVSPVDESCLARARASHVDGSSRDILCSSLRDPYALNVGFVEPAQGVGSLSTYVHTYTYLHTYTHIPLPSDMAPTPSTMTPSWFSGAPLSKFLAASSLLIHAAVRHQQNQLSMHSQRIRVHAEIVRYFSSKMTFGGALGGELILGTLLLVQAMRLTERFLGSRRFFLYLATANLISILLEMMYVQIDFFYRKPYQYMGPYATLGALFIIFHRYMPRLYPQLVQILGFSFSEKALLYAWFFQCAGLGGFSTLLATALGAMGGILALPLLPRLDVPDVLVALGTRIAHAMGEPTSTPIISPIVMRQAAAAVPQQQAPLIAQRRRPVVTQEADPAAVDQLVGMGFPRERVVQALRMTNNDVQRAADRLLSGA